LRRNEPQPGAPPDPGSAVPERDPDRLAEDPVAAAYRRLLTDLDEDPEARPASGEARARRVARGAGIEREPPLAGAVALTSAVTLVPVHVYGADRVAAPLRLGLAEGGERFAPAGGDARDLPPGTPVVRDADGVVSTLAREDAARARPTPDSEGALALAVGPRVAASRVLPEAVRTLETYASVVGWQLAGVPEAVEL